MSKLTKIPVGGERRTFYFYCDRCHKLLAKAIAESSTLLLNGESQFFERLFCEDCSKQP